MQAKQLNLFEPVREILVPIIYSKTCVERPLSKRPKVDFQDQLSLNAGQKYCRMLQGEHSAILLTFIKLPFVVKTFVLSFLSGRFSLSGLTVCVKAILNKFMLTYSTGLDVGDFVYVLIYIRTLYIRATTNLTSLRISTASPEPSLLDNTISTKLLFSGSYVLCN